MGAVVSYLEDDDDEEGEDGLQSASVEKENFPDDQHLYQDSSYPWFQVIEWVSAEVPAGRVWAWDRERVKVLKKIIIFSYFEVFCFSFCHKFFYFNKYPHFFSISPLFPSWYKVRKLFYRGVCHSPRRRPVVSCVVFKVRSL